MNQFSQYGRTARPLRPGVGKTFVVFPATSTLGTQVLYEWTQDENGFLTSFSDTTGDGIAAALALCISGRGDQILLMPGTYTISTAISATSKNDVHIMGLGTSGSVILNGSAASIFSLVTCSGWEFTNIQFNIASTLTAITLNGCNGFDIHGNTFLSAVGGSGSNFILMTTAACNYNNIHDNQFLSNLVVTGGVITQDAHITGLGIGNTIEHNTFMGGRVTTDNAGVVTNGILFNHAADAGNLVRFNSFTEFNGATFTNGVNYGTTALPGSVMAYANNFVLVTAANAIVNGSNSAGFANNIANGTV